MQTTNTEQCNGSAKEIDPFANVERLRLNQNFSEMVKVERTQLRTLVQKPKKQSWVQTHPDENFWFMAYLLTLEETGESYFIEPSIALALKGEVKPVLLIPTITRQDMTFLWPIQMPGEDGVHNDWHACALEAAKKAQKVWTRIYFKSLDYGQYEVLTASAEYEAPKWPEKTINDYLRSAFKDRFISTLDHTILKNLRGEE